MFVNVRIISKTQKKDYGHNWVTPGLVAAQCTNLDFPPVAPKRTSLQVQVTDDGIAKKTSSCQRPTIEFQNRVESQQQVTGLFAFIPSIHTCMHACTQIYTYMPVITLHCITSYSIRSHSSTLHTSNLSIYI